MKSGDALRLKRAIESDRMSMTATSTELIVKDLETVLQDYFKLSGSPSLSINYKDGSYVVEITFKADALKTFAVLPA
ncbi:MAG: hypothetical protein IJW64_05635 [Clostridia bacterium]|nr:hypothetical protein [Clostridia bacterium]